jgi:DNA-binding NarL/FixJ family response regulator
LSSASGGRIRPIDFSLSGRIGHRYGRQARNKLDHLDVIDINGIIGIIPGMDGVETTRAICKEFPEAVIIMLSTHDGEEDVYRSFQAGARTYMLKTAAREDLIQTIRAVHTGERCISPAIGARLAERMTHVELTAREIEVLKLIAKGRSNKEIGSALGIAEVTVKLHVGHILTKLNASDRTQATTIALQRGVLHLD